MFPEYTETLGNQVNISMKLTDLIEASTKDGREITFTRTPDSEKENRGFVVDYLQAFIDGKVVGYLKMSYVSRKNFLLFYPTIFNYIAQIGGSHLGFDFEERHINPYKLNDDETRKLLYYASCKVLGGWVKGKEDFDNLNRIELLKVLREYEEKLLASREGEKFKKFKNYHVDKALVDFIRVEDEDNKRLGIGTALYIEGAKWMKESNKRLYASTLQQPAAAACWAVFKEKGMTAKDKRGMYLVV